MADNKKNTSGIPKSPIRVASPIIYDELSSFNATSPKKDTAVKTSSNISLSTALRKEKELNTMAATTFLDIEVEIQDKYTDTVKKSLCDAVRARNTVANGPLNDLTIKKGILRLVKRGSASTRANVANKAIFRFKVAGVNGAADSVEKFEYTYGNLMDDIRAINRDYTPRGFAKAFSLDCRTLIAKDIENLENGTYLSFEDAGLNFPGGALNRKYGYKFAGQVKKYYLCDCFDISLYPEDIKKDLESIIRIR